MGFNSLKACVEFLDREGELVRISQEMDPNLEMAEVHNRVFEAGGPAVFYENVKGSRFPAVSNLFGTYERALKILEPGLERIKHLIALKSSPFEFFQSPITSSASFASLFHALPWQKRKGPVLQEKCKISDLPMIRCWPGDGGAFIMLPQVFSQDPGSKSIMNSNLGMYRVQMSGGDYAGNREVGLHYQLHRGIGNHHAKALEREQPLRVSIFVGGPPAHTLGAVMPLPEGMPEIAFAGLLAGRRFRYGVKSDSVISLDADFCITGRVVPGKTKKEGPFGDHLGYYSMAHDFPYLEVESVYHRKDAVWPFTVVGRPPREDSIFGRLIHEMTASAVPDTIPGVKAVHAVDAAGVHPLLLAKAEERYVPFEDQKPRELLTHACAILGTGQLSLAKYLLICSHSDNPDLDVSDEMGFMAHLLERIDFKYDLHFQTCTTMDTLDYSSQELNQGSKLIMAAAGEKKRELLKYLPGDINIPNPFSNPKLAGPGMLVIEAPGFQDYDDAGKMISALTDHLSFQKKTAGFPLMVIADDAMEVSDDFNTFLWTTFSRSNPSHDIYGVGSSTDFKHWGCAGPLIIDARKKPFHAPELEQDKEIIERVNKLGRPGRPLYRII